MESFILTIMLFNMNTFRYSLKRQWTTSKAKKTYSTFTNMSSSEKEKKRKKKKERKKDPRRYSNPGSLVPKRNI